MLVAVGVAVGVGVGVGSKEVQTVTETGAAELTRDPSPNWPLVLSPQHLAEHVPIHAHEWVPPADTSRAPSKEGFVEVGEVR